MAHDWLSPLHSDKSTGIVLLTGCPRPTERKEGSHEDIEIAIPGRTAVVRLASHSETGRNFASEVRGHHVSIIPDRQPHQVLWRAEAELTVIFLSSTLVAQAAEELSSTGQLHIRENYTAIDPVIRQLGLTAKNTLQGSEAGTLYATSLAHVLAVHLVQHYGVQRPMSGLVRRLPNHLLRRATEFMLSNLAVNIHLDDVARAAGMSRFHFAHMFKSTTGMGPHRYLTLARVERAKELLRGTETELSAIAQLLGFSDQSHMTSVFRRFTGTTPNTYRHALRT